MPVHNTVSTELDAVNTMLSVIGETPVNSLTGALPADVAVAVNILRETSREIQLEGWHFNSEEKYPLNPGSMGEISLPPDVFRVSLLEPDSRDVVLRGSRLYDRANHTYTFTEVQEVTIYRLLDYAEIPDAFRWYITVRAARKFQDRVVGSSEQHSFTRDDEAAARILAAREDTEIARPSMAKGEATTFISGWTVSQTLRR